MSTSRYTVDPDLFGIATKQLEELSARSPEAEPKLVTTVRSDALQNLQLRATVEGHSFISDEPMTKGGHDAGPAPLRYFLAGLIMCHQVWFIKAAVRRRVEIVKLSGEISAFSGAMVSAPDGGAAEDGGPWRPLSRFEYSMWVHSPAPAEVLRGAAEEGLRFCPAMATVSQSTPIVLRLFVNDELISAKTYGGR